MTTRKRRKTVHVAPNEWITIAWEGQHEECCDCGLRHVVDYRVHRGKLQFRARRLTDKRVET